MAMLRFSGLPSLWLIATVPALAWGWLAPVPVLQHGEIRGTSRFHLDASNTACPDCNRDTAG